MANMANNPSMANNTFNNVHGSQYNINDFAPPQYHFNLLHHVDEAPYNSSARELAAGCLDGTRVALLETIHQWVSTDGTLLFWLNGQAGTGKTTIAHSISEYYDSNGLLGASFFFSRDQQACRDTKYLFQTIAFQLGNAFPSLKDAIANVMKDQTIVTSNLQSQLRKLILEPVRVARSLPSRIVIVLDALDECEELNSVSRLIRLLVNELKNKSFPLKFFVTSRPEYSIRSLFLSQKVKTETSPFSLHNIEHSNVQGDIRRLVESELEEIADNNREILEGDDSWPGMDDVDAIVEMAGSLFIVAATVLKFLRPDSPPRDPRLLLAIILRKRSHDAFNAPESHPFRSLDNLYADILRHAARGFIDTLGQWRLVVGTILLAFRPLPVQELGGLLNMEGETKAIVDELHSVLLVPSNNGPIQPFHLSFRDYLTTKLRCDNTGLFLDPLFHHTEITRSCLAKMISSLKRNICDIKDPLILNSDVDGLEEMMEQNVPGDLRYACQYWALHLQQSSLDESLLDLFRSFAFGSILHWIELLSLLGDAERAQSSLITARVKFSEKLPARNDLVRLLRDTEEMISSFHLPIVISALQVYHLALCFTPKTTLLYCTFAPRLFCIQGEGNPNAQILLHPDLSSSLNDLGNQLGRRFDHRGQWDDLDNAITLHRKALELRKPPHPDRAQSLSNLASTLVLICNSMDLHSALEMAIAVVREPVEPLDLFLELRHMQLDEIRQFPRLGEAIALLTAALMEIDPMDFGDTVDSAIFAYVLSFFKPLLNVEEAILLLQEALVLQPRPHPDRWHTVCNLADAFRMVSSIRKQRSYFDQAMTLLWEELGVESVPQVQPNSVKRLVQVLQRKFRARAAAS